MLTDSALAPEIQHRESQFFRRRPLFWLTLAFAFGIAFDHQVMPGLPVAGAALIAAVLFCVAVLLFARPEVRTAADEASRPPTWWSLWIPHLPIFAAVILAISSGVLMHALRVRIAPASDVSRRTPALPSFCWLRGTILSASQPTKRCAWVLDIETLGPDRTLQSSACGRVALQGTPAELATLSSFKEGDRVELLARIEAPPDVSLPESFDYKRWLLQQGIRRSGTIFPGSVTHFAAPSWLRPDLQLRALSSVFAARAAALMQTVSSDPGHAALLNSLLFGRREHTDAADRESFAVSGAAHLLAVSGLQVQFLAMLIWAAVARAGISRRRSAWLVLVLAWIYCALAGSDAPIVRAAVMISAYLGGIIFWRQSDPLNELAASALVILIAAPAELFGAGFQLSYLAVLALVTLCPAFESAWKAWRESQSNMPLNLSPTIKQDDWITKYVRTAAFVSIAAWLGTAPAVAWHMGRFSTLSLIVNLVAVPLSTFCMVAGLLMLVASMFSTPLATMLATLTLGLLIMLQQFVGLIAAVPFASLELPAPTVLSVLIYGALLMWIWLARGQGAQVRRLVFVLPSCVLVLCAGAFLREPVESPSVTVLDLRSGRAALVQAPGGGAALIDCGGLGEGPRIAESLRRQGIQRLSLLVITADDSDAIGGAAELLNRLPCSNVLLPRDSSPSQTRRDLERFLTQRGIAYSSPEQGSALIGPGEVRWTFDDDGPPQEKPAGLDTALCVRVALPGTSILFVPARSGAALKRLLASSKNMEAQIVRVTPGTGGRWPSELTQLLRSSNCHTIIAGESRDPEESAGLDLNSLAQAMNIRLLSPHRDGSLRLQADVGTTPTRTLQRYREGQWRPLD